MDDEVVKDTNENAGILYCGSKRCRDFFLYTLNAKVLAFLWRATFTGEFLTVIQSLKFVICRSKFPEHTCLHLSNGHHTTEEIEVYQVYTTWQTILMMTWLIPSLLFVPLLGMYLNSGQTKRAFVMLTALQSLSSVFLLFNAVYPEMYVSGYIMESVMHALYGFMHGFRVITYSYVAQVSTHYTPAQRTTNMIGLTTARSLSAISFPFLLGFIMQRYGYIVTFIITLAIDMVSLFYAAFLLPDPVSIMGLPTKAPTTASQWKCFKESLWSIFSPLYDYPRILLPVGIAFFILDGLTISINNFLPIYLTHSPISFDSQQLGTFLMTQKAFVIVGTVFVSNVFIRLVGARDKGLVLACFVAYLFMFSVLIVARSELLLYVSSLAFIINYSYIGAGFAYLSRAIPGTSFVSMYTLMASFSLVGTGTTFPLINWIYKETVEWYPQFVFVVFNAMALLGLLIWGTFMWCTRKSRDRRVALVDESSNGTTYGAVSSQSLSLRHQSRTADTLEHGQVSMSRIDCGRSV